MPSAITGVITILVLIFPVTASWCAASLLYYSFGDLLKFKLEPVLGKRVVTPVGIMNKYVNERGTPKAQLDFVLFLDTPSRQTPRPHSLMKDPVANPRRGQKYLTSESVRAQVTR